MAQRDFSKLDLITTVDHAHLRTIRLEKDRTRGEHQGYSVERQLKVHVRVGSREQSTRWIRNIELDGQRPRRGIDRLGGSRDRSHKAAIRERDDVHRRLRAWLHV